MASVAVASVPVLGAYSGRRSPVAPAGTSGVAPASKPAPRTTPPPATETVASAHVAPTPAVNMITKRGSGRVVGSPSSEGSPQDYMVRRRHTLHEEYRTRHPILQPVTIPPQYSLTATIITPHHHKDRISGLDGISENPQFNPSARVSRSYGFGDDSYGPPKGNTAASAAPPAAASAAPPAAAPPAVAAAPAVPIPAAAVPISANPNAIARIGGYSSGSQSGTLNQDPLDQDPHQGR